MKNRTIGLTLKTLGGVVLFLGVIGSLILAQELGGYRGMNTQVLMYGIISTVFVSLNLAGFGAIIEELTMIRTGFGFGNNNSTTSEKRNVSDDQRIAELREQLRKAKLENGGSVNDN